MLSAPHPDALRDSMTDRECVPCTPQLRTYPVMHAKLHAPPTCCRVMMVKRRTEFRLDTPLSVVVTLEYIHLQK